MSNSNSRVPAHRASEGWITRGQVAELLGVSISKVRAMEASGQLSPITEGGVHLFERRQIDALRPPAPVAVSASLLPENPTLAQITTACFDAFNKGQRVTDVCVSLKLPIEQVGSIRRRWIAANTDSEPTTDDREQEAEEKRWRAEMDKTYADWEKDLLVKWGRRTPPKVRPLRPTRR
jgi:hypothetical protein